MKTPNSEQRKKKISFFDSIYAIVFFVLGTLFLEFSGLYFYYSAHNSGFTFLGIALILYSVILLEIDDFNPLFFFSYHLLFLVGIGIVLWSIGSDYVFTSTNTFEIGSFALVISTFLLTQEDKLHKLRLSALFYSSTSVILFFVSGGIVAFNEILQLSVSTSNTAIVNEYLTGENHFIQAFFLLGVLDLTIVALQFISIASRSFLQDKSEIPK